MKKIIVSLMIAISSLFGAVAGAGNDGRIMDKAYLDVYFGEEVSYQYVNYKGNGFELETRKLNKVFNAYSVKGDGKVKFIISGKISLPNDIQDTVSLTFASGKSNVQISQGHYARKYFTYINNIAMYSKSKDFKVARDRLNNPYIDFRIEAFGHKGSLKHLIKSVSAISFSIAYTPKQTKRGEVSSLIKKPAIIYCVEE